MKITAIFTGDKPLIDIGNKYNSWKVLVFISTGGAGVHIKVIRIYLIYPTLILMFLFDLLYLLVYLVGVSIPVTPETIKKRCVILT